MTSRPLRAAGTTVAVLGLILGMGACSSDVDPETFCKEGKAAIESDQLDASEDMDAFAKKINEIKAPPEIKDDWGMLQQYLNNVASLGPKLQSEDPEVAEAAQAELMEKTDTEKMDAAEKSVSEYVNENCEN